MPSRPKNIIIYNGPGVSEDCVEETYKSLTATVNLDRCRILIVDADYLSDGDWEKESQLIIIPGGRARPYYSSFGSEWHEENVARGQVRSLKNIGVVNQRIKNMVENGGSYLGICAGGYYGAAKTIFEKGGENEVIDEGALKFFPGIAEGPAYGLNLFDYHSEKGARAAIVSSQPFSIDSIPVYFNGGCYFHMDDHPIPSDEILAVYENVPDDKKVAMVGRTVGAGRIVLSGIHLEFSSFILFSKTLDYLGVPQRV